MKSEMQIISEEYVKPSSPTPCDRKIHNLSLLDQVVPPFFAPMILYYPNLGHQLQSSSESISITTRILKESLSLALTRFYPLAGRIRDNLSVDCNDEGVLFVVAEFEENLSELLKNPSPNADLNHIPGQLTWEEPGPGDQVAKFQVNHYACGGIVIGMIFYHKLSDAISMAAFVKDWSIIARGDRSGPSPTFDFHSIFPNNPEMRRDSHLFTVMKRYFKIGKPVVRRYLFDAEAITTLRARVAQDGKIPSRVEIVTAVMWKYFMAACAAVNDGQPKASFISHVLNLRKKADPQFPDNSFGNLLWLGAGSSPNNEADRDVGRLLGKVREAIRRMDSGSVKRMEGGDGFSGYSENLEGSWREFPEEADYLSVTSWCNFGLYGVDFGWGKPMWVTKCHANSDREAPCLNVLWLMDTREGGGVEAWVDMDEKYSEAFDGIPELRALAKIDPSPLNIAGIH